MTVCVLFGPPGAGKGTQANLLSTRLGAVHISTGNLLREEIKSGSALGQRVKAVVESGMLVDDDLLFECFGSCLSKMPSLGKQLLLLDGVPRTIPQVDLLDQTLKLNGLSTNVVLYVSAQPQQLVERFSKRWTCSKCAYVGSFDTSVEATMASCPKCGTTPSAGSASVFFRRKDDEPEAVRTRFKVFESETAPILGVYRNRGLVAEIDGLLPVEQVYARVVARLY